MNKQSIKIIKCDFPENRKYTVIISQNDKEICGTASVDLSTECVYLYAVFVKKEYRKQKIGTNIVNEVFKIAKQEKKKSIYLTVKKVNKVGIKFWKKMKFSISNCDATDYWMSIPL